jgi:hypothetical protein
MLNGSFLILQTATYHSTIHARPGTEAISAQLQLLGFFPCRAMA